MVCLDALAQFVGVNMRDPDHQRGARDQGCEVPSRVVGAPATIVDITITVPYTVPAIFRLLPKATCFSVLGVRDLEESVVIWESHPLPLPIRTMSASVGYRVPVGCAPQPADAQRLAGLRKAPRAQRGAPFALQRRLRRRRRV